VRHEVAAQDAPVRRADHVRCFHEVSVSKDEQLRPDQPRRIEGGEHTDQAGLRDCPVGHHPAPSERPEIADQVPVGEEEEEEQRERHERLRELRDDRVDHSAEVAGGGPDGQRDHERDDHRSERDLERRPQPVEQADQLVAAYRAVRAEHEQVGLRALRRRQQVAVVAERRIRRVRDVRPRPDRLLPAACRIDERLIAVVPDEAGHDRTADERERQQHRDRREREHPAAVAPQPPPPAAPRAEGAQRRSLFHRHPNLYHLRIRESHPLRSAGEL
jgi:hypothetical protein